MNATVNLSALRGVTRLQVGEVWLAVEAWGGTEAAPTVKLVGVNSREAAEALRGQDAVAQTAELDAGPERVFYHALIGLPVVTPSGNPIGTVEGVQENGPQDLLVIPMNGAGRLVPLQAPYVVLRDDRIELDAPPGLLDDLPDEEDAG